MRKTTNYYYNTRFTIVIFFYPVHSYGMHMEHREVRMVHLIIANIVKMFSCLMGLTFPHNLY